MQTPFLLITATIEYSYFQDEGHQQEGARLHRAARGVAEGGTRGVCTATRSPVRAALCVTGGVGAAPEDSVYTKFLRGHTTQDGRPPRVRRRPP